MSACARERRRAHARWRALPGRGCQTQALVGVGSAHRAGERAGRRMRHAPQAQDPGIPAASAPRKMNGDPEGNCTSREGELCKTREDWATSAGAGKMRRASHMGMEDSISTVTVDSGCSCKHWHGQNQSDDEPDTIAPPPWISLAVPVRRAATGNTRVLSRGRQRMRRIPRTSSRQRGTPVRGASKIRKR